MSHNDDLPQKICVACYEIVRQAKYLRLLAIANDTGLRSLLFDDYQDNTEANTPDPTGNPTGSREVVSNDKSEKNTNTQSQKEKEHTSLNNNEISLNSHKSTDRESRKRKNKTNKDNIEEPTNDENVSIS